MYMTTSIYIYIHLYIYKSLHLCVHEQEIVMFIAHALDNVTMPILHLCSTSHLDSNEHH